MFSSSFFIMSKQREIGGSKVRRVYWTVADYEPALSYSVLCNVGRVRWSIVVKNQNPLAQFSPHSKKCL